ncbi:LacI family transcriptional regulator [Microbacterium nanhaiense]|uniref:LacI family transcriptional regulator n=1 Tax=Microbacterium nanhaiense TaxID=1301026 RepID=A0ABQ2MZN8_9MICO|nr:LacI family DNA-binding transcriptional regulator [Microbacterium nanhaiense]GGO63074.1 LacI family transcriptional regulator [Microbacterium nanhaiense]
MVRIDDVAKRAGVSISTVSYALSGKRPVSERTREKIHLAARELGYLPNAGARMLAGRRTHIFALTEPFRADTHAPSHMAFVLAASIAARRHGYDILLLTDEDASQGMRRVEASGLVDGIIVLDVAPNDERAELARSIATPTVFVGVPNDATGLMCVDLDFSAAAATAVDRLADAGHRKIAMLGHPAGHYEATNYAPRVRQGFRDRARERGLDAVFRPLSETQFAAEDAYRLTLEFLDDGVTGIVLNSEERSYKAVLDAVSARGMDVPRDVSLISVGAIFDTSGYHRAIDSIPLIPERSCDLALEELVDAVERQQLDPGVRLVTPEYRSYGSVGAHSSSPRGSGPTP